MELVQKAAREADEWYVAQTVEAEWTKTEKSSFPPLHRKWKPPDTGWIMCNVGMEYSNGKGIVGAAWVLRNDGGLVICHSRRALS